MGYFMVEEVNLSSPFREGAKFLWHASFFVVL